MHPWVCAHPLVMRCFPPAQRMQGHVAALRAIQYDEERLRDLRCEKLSIYNHLGTHYHHQSRQSSVANLQGAHGVILAKLAFDFRQLIRYGRSILYKIWVPRILHDCSHIEKQIDPKAGLWQHMGVSVKQGLGDQIWLGLAKP